MSPVAAAVRTTSTTTNIATIEASTTTTAREFASAALDNNHSDRNIITTTGRATGRPLTMATGEESSRASAIEEVFDKEWSSAMKMPTFSNVVFAMTLLLVCCSLATGVDALKCQMCGQYNEGVGSITPCLNYSDQHSHLYLKDCPKKTEKFCVKYVSELSIVRDCSTECVEKEIWETQTYCCNTDGCNGSSHQEASIVLLAFITVLYALSTAVLGNHHSLQVRR